MHTSSRTRYIALTAHARVHLSVFAGFSLFIFLDSKQTLMQQLNPVLFTAVQAVAHTGYAIFVCFRITLTPLMSQRYAPHRTVPYSKTHSESERARPNGKKRSEHSEFYVIVRVCLASKPRSRRILYLDWLLFFPRVSHTAKDTSQHSPYDVKHS